MESVSFSIYHPDNKFHWTPNLIILSLAAIPLSAALIFDDYFKKGSEAHRYLTSYFIFLILVALTFLFTSFIRRKSLNGVLNGEIIFEENHVRINQTIYKLEDIVNLDFSIRDYYDMPSKSLNADFNPRKSQGVSNYVSFDDTDRNHHQIYFQLRTKNHYQALAPFLNNAINYKKISFNRGIELVGIENIKV